MTVSFAANIRPLFTNTDVRHMAEYGVQLSSYSWMSTPGNAQSVYDQVSAGTMPPSDSGEPRWTQAQVGLFQAWIDGGYQP